MFLVNLGNSHTYLHLCVVTRKDYFFALTNNLLFWCFLHCNNLTLITSLVHPRFFLKITIKSKLIRYKIITQTNMKDNQEIGKTREDKSNRSAISEWSKKNDWRLKMTKINEIKKKPAFFCVLKVLIILQ